MAVESEIKKNETQVYTHHPPLASLDIRRASFLRSFSKYIKKYKCERRALLVASVYPYFARGGQKQISEPL